MITKLITFVKKSLTLRSCAATACVIFLVGMTACLAQPVEPRRLSDGTRLVEVTAWQWGFDPSVITAKVGETIHVRAASLDVAHTLTCKDLKIDLPIPPKGSTVDFEFTAERAGDFNFICGAPCGPAVSRQKIRLLVTP